MKNQKEDLKCAISVTQSQIDLEEVVECNINGRQVQLKLPGSAKNGSILRLHDAGLNGGDLYVEIKIVPPSGALRKKRFALIILLLIVVLSTLFILSVYTTDSGLSKGLRAIVLQAQAMLSFNGSPRIAPLKHIVNKKRRGKITDSSGLIILAEDITHETGVVERHYPRPHLAPAVVGISGNDGGLSNIELSKNSILSAGQDVQLTIVTPVQEILNKTVAGLISVYSPKAVRAMIVNIDGTVRAMAQSEYPEGAQINNAAPSNYLVCHVYEPGEIITPLIEAAARDRKIVPPLTANFEALYEIFRLWGLGVRSGIEIEGESIGILRPEKWTPISLKYLPKGYETAWTVAQLSRAFTGLANMGAMPLLSIIKNGERKRPVPVRVLSQETAKTALLKLERFRYGKNMTCQVNGTAKAVERGTYKKGHVTMTHVGIFPPCRPEYTIVIQLDRPHQPSPHFSTKTELIIPVYDELSRQMAIGRS